MKNSSTFILTALITFVIYAALVFQAQNILRGLFVGFYAIWPLGFSLYICKRFIGAVSQATILLSSVSYGLRFAYGYRDGFSRGSTPWDSAPQGELMLLFVSVFSLLWMIPAWVFAICARRDER